MKILSLTVCFFLSYFCLNAQVDLRTGTSQYEIPIFSHTDARSGLGTSVSLSYNSGGGIRVNDHAGMVGQNWNLNAGGQVTRIQHGEPDDQYQTENITVNSNSQIYETNSSQNYAFQNYYPNGFLYTTFLQSEIPLEKAFSPRFKEGTNSSNKFQNSPRAQDDKEQDVFQFSVNGISGSFVIGKNGQVEVLQNNRIKVQPIYFTTAEMITKALRTRIKSFLITDPNGVQYIFEDYELNNSVVLKEKLQDPGNSSNPVSLSVYTSEKITPEKYTISTWFITAIKNPLINKSVQFTYDNLNLEYYGVKLPSYQNFSGAGVDEKKSVSITESVVFAKTKLLKTISYPGGYKVDFFYQERADYTGYGYNGNYLYVPRLSGISAKYNSKIIHSVTLIQQYFHKWDIIAYPQYSPPTKFLRLCLTDILFDDLKYSFDYYKGTQGDEKDIVPSVNSFAQDYWGYYNASVYIDDNLTTYDKNALVNYLSNMDLDVKDGRAKNGLLKKITLPTGGNIEYEYEQNDRLDKDGNYKKAGGVRVSKITARDNVAASPNVTTTYKYVQSGGVTSGWGGEENNFSFRTGIQLYRNDHSGYKWGGIGNNALVSEVIGIFLSGGHYGKALRAIDKFVKLSPVYRLIMVAIEAATRVIVSFLDLNQDYSISTYALSPFANGTTIELNYSRVETQIVNAANIINSGKTVTEFTVPLNYNTEILPSVFPLAYKQRMDEWKYNLPAKETILDNTGKILQETIYNYSFSSTNLGANCGSYKTEVNNSYCGRFDFSHGVDPNWFSQDYYTMKKGNANLTSTIQRVYSRSNSNYSETITYSNYSGTNNNQPRETYSYNSKGDKVGQTYYYSSDYTISTGAMGLLANNNIVNVPIAVLSWFDPAGSSGPSARMFTGITITEYSIAPDGSVKPYKVYTAYNKEPVPASLVGSFNPVSIFINYPNLVLSQPVVTNSFGTDGDIIFSLGDGNEKVSSIYDFEGKFKTASVTNVNPSDIAYTSFESTELGNWTLINNPVYINDIFSPTGQRYLNFSSNNTLIRKMALDPQLQYQVTYWSNNGSLFVNGTSANSIITINGWSLYKHVISGVAMANITGVVPPGNGDVITGVDELRIHPVGTFMNTTAYDPALGKVAECDANNRIVYYRYDNYGKLIMVQDQNRNATKTYEYNTIHH